MLYFNFKKEVKIRIGREEFAKLKSFAVEIRKDM